MSTGTRKTGSAGFTLVELMIGVTVLFILTAGLVSSVVRMNGLAVTGTVDGTLQDMGATAISTIVSDLKKSGFDTVGGSAFPHMFDNGNATGAFAGHAHAAAVEHAYAGDPDFGTNREIVFLRLADGDGNSVPDLDGQGRRLWDASVLSYVLVTRADGVNVLQRRVNSASPRSIARYVERITFDDNTTSGFAVPLRAIRVRIWFRKQDEQGRVHRFFTEAMVDLRNG